MDPEIWDRATLGETQVSCSRPAPPHRLEHRVRQSEGAYRLGAQRSLAPRKGRSAHDATWDIGEVVSLIIPAPLAAGYQ